jgi:hypothetical protein
MIFSYFIIVWQKMYFKKMTFHFYLLITIFTPAWLGLAWLGEILTLIWVKG